MNIVSLVHRRTRWHFLSLLVIFFVACLLIGCAGIPLTNHAGCPAVSSLRGEGSTFDAPLFDTLFSMYAGTPCGLSVQYYAAGSGLVQNPATFSEISQAVSGDARTFLDGDRKQKNGLR